MLAHVYIVFTSCSSYEDINEVMKLNCRAEGENRCRENVRMFNFDNFTDAEYLIKHSINPHTYAHLS